MKHLVAGGRQACIMTVSALASRELPPIRHRFCGIFEEPSKVAGQPARGYNSNMSTNPVEIDLSPEQRRLVAEFADRTGKPWNEVLAAALQPLAEQNTTLYDVFARSGGIGLYDGPTDLSSDSRHMEGFGGDGT
jgi:hypothetical protein